jgi:hypothetical protein
MYDIKFAEYNDVLKSIMSEKKTMENIIDLALDGKPSKEEKEYLSSSEKWAEYAFANDKVYYTTIYQDEKPIACIDCSYLQITIEFLDYQADELVNYLTLVYDKYDMEVFFKKYKKINYQNNELFLSKIVSYTFEGDKKTVSDIFFKNTGLALVYFTEILIKEKDWNTQKKEVKVNITNNFIRPPENYRDFEYLLDYQNNIKPEYFDLPKSLEI